MSVLGKDDFFAKLHERLGDDTSDESIAFLEDMTDTYNDLEARANGDGVNWEQKYRDLDESWKKRYRHRFFNGGANSVPPEEDKDNDGGINPEDISVEDLFK